MAEEEASGTDIVCSMVAEGQGDHYHNFAMNIIMELLTHVPDKQTAAIIAESTVLYVCLAHGLSTDVGLDTMIRAIRDRYEQHPEEEGVTMQ